MKINRKELLTFLKKTNRVHNKALPILEGILINSNGDARVTDLIAEVSTKLNSVETTPFEVVIDNRKNLELILSKLTDDFIIFEVTSGVFYIKHKKGEIKLTTYTPVDYPHSIHLDCNYIGSINFDFLDDIKQASKFTLKDDFRPVMQGVYIGTKDGKIEICSTDGQMLFKSVVNSSNFDFEVILPTEYNTLIGNGNLDILEYRGAKVAKFYNDSLTISIRCIDGKYPNYNAVIPENNPINIKIDKDELKNTINIALLTANKNTNRIVIDTENLVVTSEDLDLSTESKTDFKFEKITGESISIGFNGKFLLKLIDNLKDNTFVLSMSAPDKVVLINENNKTFLLMPLMN